jgi:hypothetical protein
MKPRVAPEMVILIENVIYEQRLRMLLAIDPNLIKVIRTYYHHLFCNAVDGSNSSQPQR